MASVQVVVRLRPMNENEKKEGTLPVIKAKTQEKSVTVIKGQGSRQARSTFSFDHVFTAFSTQTEVFDELKPVIRDVMQGFESTVFAYGQTGTGKTYTMEGNLSSPEHYGIIPRSAQAIFEALKKPEFVSHNVVCTYLEIYNEELGDLLSDDVGVTTTSLSSSTPMKGGNRSSADTGKKIDIMNGKTGTFVRGLTEREVHSASDVLALMQRAQQSRKIGETKMNKASSRSHCVFSMIINANRKLSDGSIFEFSGKMNMVDLAGSECAGKAAMDKSTGNEIARERERMNINRSLLTLGRVIKTLKDMSLSSKKSNNVRIPYRDSKLTRVLQESLGGRCKTIIIATLSPSITEIEESISTLNYAQAANGIVNKPITSAYLSLGSSSTVSSIGSGGSTEPNTVEHWQEMECRLEYMQAQVEEAKAALARKHLQQQELLERAEKAEGELVDLENKYDKAQSEISDLKITVAQEKEEKQVIATLLKETEISLKKTTAILEATQHTEVCLTAEAKSILQSLENSIKDGDRLHQLLAVARDNEIKNRNATKKFHSSTASMLISIIEKLNELTNHGKDHDSSILSFIESESQLRDASFSSFSQVLHEVSSNIIDLADEISSIAMNENGLKQSLLKTSKEATETIGTTKSLLMKAEKQLNNSIQATVANISSSSNDLKDRHKDFIQCSDDCLSQLEGNIISVKDQMNTMVSNATASLSNIRESSNETRKGLELFINQLSENSQGTAVCLKNIISEHRERLNSTDEMFSSGNKLYGNMTIALKKQRTMVKNKGAKHVREINDLSEIITEQTTMFNEAYEKQKLIHEEALSNMLKGIQQIMHTEMQRFTEHSEQLQTTFTSSNQSMLSKNQNVESVASELLADIHKANGQLFANIKNSQATTHDIEHVFKDSKSTLTKLEDRVIEGQSAEVIPLEGAIESIHKLETIEGDIDSLDNQTSKTMSEIDNFVSEQTLVEASRGFEELKQKAENELDHTVNTIMSNITCDLNAIEAPRESFCKDMSASLLNVTTCLERGTEKMIPQLTKQSMNSDAIRDSINSYGDSFEQLSRDYCKEMQDKTEALKTSSSEFNASSTSLISTCQSNLSDAKAIVRDFAIKDMKSEKKVSPLEQRSKIEYEKTLTSTPSADVILKGLKIVENDESQDDSVSIRSETSFASNSGINTSQESEGSNVSQNNRPSPLVELSLNKENIDNTLGKDDSKKNLKIKTRPNSRQRNDMRKRVPPTPTRGGIPKRPRERL